MAPIPVGGEQGVAYKGKEGVGHAFRLGEADTVSAFTKLMDAQKKVPKKGEKEKVAKKAFKTKANELVSDDPWHKHQKELQGDFDEIMDMGTDIMVAGELDPFTGSDAASVSFQKKIARYKQKTKQSKQVQEQFIKDRDRYHAPGSLGKLTEESNIANLEYYKKNDLNTIIDKGLLPPRLMFKEPDFELAKYLGETAKNLGTSNKDPEDEDFYEQVGIMLADPSAREFQYAIKDKIHQLNEEELAHLKDLALINKVEPLEQLAKMQLESYFKTEPIDIAALISANLPGYETTTKVYENTDNVKTTKVDKKVTKERADTQASFIIKANPKLLPQMIKQGMAKDLESATKYLSGEIVNRMETQTTRKTERKAKSGWEGFGVSTKDVDEDHDLWEQAYRGEMGDTPEEKRYNQELAANYISGTKTNDGWTIESGRTVEDIVYEAGRWSATTPEGLTTPDSESEYDLNNVEMQFVQKGDEYYIDEESNKQKRPTTHTKSETWNLDDSDPDSFKDYTYTEDFYHGGVRNKSGKLFMESKADADALRNNSQGAGKWDKKSKVGADTGNKKAGKNKNKPGKLD